MKKILFLIHDLGAGGAEKVLVNLVNNMDTSKFDITVMTLFDVGVNRENLASHIRYIGGCAKMYPGNSHLMKLLSPSQLHQLYIKDHYDIEVAYLEGPSARVISGCPDKRTRLFCWIHSTIVSLKEFSQSFRCYNEAVSCYDRFERIVCVAETIKDAFTEVSGIGNKCCVLYNSVESDKIKKLSREKMEQQFRKAKYELISVGTLKKVKGFDRLLRIVSRLLDEGYDIHLNLLGDGPQKDELSQYVVENGLQKRVSFHGFQKNPYKYLANSDLYVCSSYSEGFSTAATEALIVGIPVCTVNVSGMKEMLGDNNKYGIITDNDEKMLYCGIKSILDSSELLLYYNKQARIRGKMFSMDTTVKAVEEMLNA